jgi:dienelactone hydrolase
MPANRLHSRRSFTWRALRRLASALAAAVAAPVAVAAQAVQPAGPLAPGVIHARVTPLGNPSYGYALFLPASYSPDRTWPVLFAFDPAARGELPVKLVRGMADRHGYIVAGSLDVRNGPMAPQVAAARVMMQDVAARLSIDPARVYVTGFSGAARFSVMLATLCQSCVTGVLAHGAGYPPGVVPAKGTSFDCFGTIGDADFNYPEVVGLHEQLDALGVPSRLRIFAGPHGWPPTEVWEQAFEWLELRAMQRGLRARDAAFVAAQWRRGLDRAERHEGQGERLHAWYEYEKLASELSGLIDVGPARKRAETLRRDPDVERARTRERDDLDRHRRVVTDISRMVHAASQRDADPTLRARLRVQFKELRTEAASVDARSARVARRMVSDVFAQAFTTARAQLLEGDLPAAEALLAIALDASPDAGLGWVHLAAVYALEGRREAASRALDHTRRTELDAGWQLARLAADLRARQKDKEAEELLRFAREGAGARSVPERPQRPEG